LRDRARRALRLVLFGLLGALLLIQAVPVERSNPPLETEVPAPPDVRTVLRRSCYDCHSNETVWPWYSRIAPVSWLVAGDVKEGREKLNFSTWNRYSEAEKTKKMKKCWEEVEEGEMPPWYYLPAHRAAVLSSENRAILSRWATGR
jgi:hypothetical protein